MFQRIEEILHGIPGQVGCYIYYPATGECFAYQADMPLVAASVIKLPILVEAFRQREAGMIRFEEMRTIRREDKLPSCGALTYMHDGLEVTLGDLVTLMIILSDNTATNAIISTLGYDHINAYCARLGLTSTACQRKMLDWTAVKEGRNNYTSALDQFRLYEMLYRGEILNEELRAVAADFLSRVRSFDELQRYIPDAVTLWHKPGGLDHLTHDAGVFFLEGRPYFLGVFTWDGPSLDGQPEQARLIGRVSRLVYDFMKEKRA